MLGQKYQGQNDRKIIALTLRKLYGYVHLTQIWFQDAFVYFQQISFPGNEYLKKTQHFFYSIAWSTKVISMQI